MPETALRSERRQLYRKIVYIYFGLFSMALAERFSMSIAYGGALYLSLAALLRMQGFILRTKYDARPGKALMAVTVVFFTLAAIYIVALYPLIHRPSHAILAMAVIALPFLGRAAETALLRRHAPQHRRGILVYTLPIGALTVGSSVLAALPAGTDAAVFTAGGMLLGIALCAPLNLIFRDFKNNVEPDSRGFDDMRSIRSVRLFDGMTITAGVALNIFAFSYILYLMFVSRHDVFQDFLLSFLMVAAVLYAAYLGARRARRSLLMGKVGKNAVFLLGTAIAIFAAYVLRDSWFGTAVDISIQTMVLLLGLVLQMAGAQGLQEDMLLLVRFYKDDIDEDAMRARAERLDVWTSILSEAVFLIVLLVLVSSPLLPVPGVAGLIAYAPTVGSSVAAIPTVLLLASLWLSLRQPLTEKYSRRLKTYTAIREKGRDNPAMEKRLRSVLVQKYKKRIGVHVIRALLRPVMRHTVTGKQHVTDLPGIFVFNHREVYGPIAAVVFLPYDIRPWILYQMIEKEEITKHMVEGTFSRIRWLPPALRRWIPGALSPLIVWALRSFDPIPVYRGAQVNVIRTFTQSIECLAAGDSILLFPENPEHTYEKKVSDFYGGFASLGRLYYKKTGERLMFYPVYASGGKRELRIGEGIRFDPAGGTGERSRIVEALERRMRALEGMGKD
jgi:hypothetical protein